MGDGGGEFLNVANQLIAGIAQTDLAGRFVLVNDYYCELVGYPREELLGKTLFDITHPDDTARNAELFLSCAREGKAFIIEKRYIRKDGSEVWVRNSVSLLRDGAGRPQFIIAVSTDITAEKQARAMLEKRGEIYRSFIKQSAEAIWRFEIEEPVPVNLSTEEQFEKAYARAVLAECNDSLARMYGYDSAAEIVGSPLSAFLPRDDPANIEYLRTFIKSGYRLENAESHEIDRRGSPKFFLNNLIGVVEDGHLRRIWGTKRDITAQKQAEQKISVSEERYRKLTEAASDAIIQFDDRGEILFVNRAAERIFGYGKDEMIGQSVSKIIPETPHDKQNQPDLKRFFETELPEPAREGMEVSARRKDGREFPLEISFSEYKENGKKFFIGVARDISARRESSRTNAYLASLVESSDDAIIGKDLEGRITSWNKGAELIYGYTAEEVLGKPVTILIPPHLVHEEEEILRNIRQGKRIEHYETVRRRKDGTIIYVSLTVSPICDENGNVIGASKIARDITERKEFQNELREQQAMLALTMRSSRMGTWSRELDSNEVCWSDELEEIFGLPRGGFGNTEKNFYDLIHEDDRRKVREEVERAIAEKRDYTVEFRFYHADGSIRWMEGRGQAFYSDKGEPVRLYGIGIDITQRKQAEEALRQSAKQLTLVTDTAPVFIAHCDGDERLKFVNKVYAGRFGKTPEDFIGKKISEVIGDEAYEMLRPHIKTTLSGVPVQFEAEVPYAGIGSRFMHYSYMPEFDEEGNVVGCVAAITDIGEIKKAEEKNPRFGGTPAARHGSRRNVRLGKRSAGKKDEMVGKRRGNYRLFARRPARRTGRSAFFVAPADRERLRKEFEQVLRKGETNYVFEFGGVKNGGAAKFWQAEGSVLYDETGAPVRVLGVTQNITERKRAQKELQMANYRFRLAEEAAKGFSFDRDLETERITYSENFSRLLGYELREIPETWEEWTALIHPDDLQMVKESSIENLDAESGVHLENEYRVRHKNGHYLYLYERATVLRDDHGKAQRVIGQTIDITERKKAEVISERYRLLSERARDAILFLRKDGKIVDANMAALELYGYDHETLLQMNIADLRMPETLPYLSEQIQRADADSIQFETVHRRKDGTAIPVEVSSVGADIGGERFLMSIIRDISERKKAEKEIKRAAERAEVAQEAAHAMLYEYRPQTGEVVRTSTLQLILGYQPDEIEPTTEGWIRLIHPEDEKTVSGKIVSALAHATEYSLEYRVRHRKGHYLWLSDSARIVRDARGEVERVVGMIVDITERKQAEDRLALLAEISDLTRSIDDPVELLFAVSKTVGEHLQVERCLFNEIDLERDTETVYRDYCRNVESVAGVYKVSSHSAVTVTDMKAGKTVVNGDAKTDPRTADIYEQSYAPQGKRAYIAVPLLREGRWVASLWVSDNRPREWDEKEIDLLETIAERAWLTVEKLRAERAVRESQLHLQITTEAALMGTWQWNIKTGEVIWSPIHKHLWGLKPTPDPLTFEDWKEPIDERDLKDVLNVVENCLAGKAEYDVEYRITPKNKTETRWIRSCGRVSFDAVGKPLAMQGVSFDVTERKRAEQTLIESARRQEALFRLADRLHRTKSIADVYDATLEAIINALQCDRASILLYDEKNVMRFVAWRGLSDEYRRFAEGHSPWQSDEKNPEPISIEDVETSNLDAGLKNVLKSEGIGALAFIPLISNGKLIGKFMAYFDEPHALNESDHDLALTIAHQLAFGIDRNQAEDALRESEKRFRSMADSSPMLIWMSGTDRLFTYFNKTWLDFTGRTAEQETGEGWQKGVHPDDLENFLETYLKAFDERREFELEFRLRRHDGEYRWVLARGIPLFTPEGDFKGYIGSSIDIHERRRAEEKVRENEKTLRAYYNSSPLMMGIVELSDDSDKDILHIYDNPATCAFFGVKKDATANHFATQLNTTPENIDKWVRHYRQSQKLNRPVSFEYEESVGGEKRWISATVSCLGASGENKTRFAYVAEDTTDRKAAQAALIAAERKAAEDYQTLLQRIVPLAQTLGTARELISIYRAVGDFVRSSMPCSAFLVSFYDAENSLRLAAYVWGEGEEVDTDALPPMPITEGGGPNSQAILGKRIVVNNKDYMEIMRERPHVLIQDNGIVPNSSVVAPMIVMNRVVGTIEVQAHEAEAYKHEHTVALEMVANLAAVAIENVRLLKAEETARREAESANRAKDEFLSVLSHELRTPLNSMFGWVRMLKSGILDEAKTSQAVEVIERNVRLQNSLIEDLLDVSRIISGKMRIEKEETDFAAIVATMVEAARPLAEQKKISLVFEQDSDSYPLLGDEVRLQQVVNNLINNAVKFTPEGGVVTLKLSNSGDRVFLNVTDTGIGIEPQFLTKIFDRFLQADSTTKRAHSGLGLGLTIVRHITELHGGRVTVESEGLGKGASFTVELPLAKSVEIGAESGTLNGGASSLKGSRILLVDDDADAMIPLQIILESHQAKVACVSSASEALEKLSRERFDLIVSDVGMPQMDGYDLILTLRKSETSPNRGIPAIALTAYASAQDKERALMSGFQRHFSKPIDFDDFLAAVKNFIRKSHKR